MNNTEGGEVGGQQRGGTRGEGGGEVLGRILEGAQATADQIWDMITCMPGDYYLNR